MSWPPSPRCQPPGTHQRRGALWTRRWSLPSADRSPPRPHGGRVPPWCSTAPPADRDQQMAGKTPCSPGRTGTAAPPSPETNFTTYENVTFFSQYFHQLPVADWCDAEFPPGINQNLSYLWILTVNHNITELLIVSPSAQLWLKSNQFPFRLHNYEKWCLKRCPWSKAECIMPEINSPLRATDLLSADKCLERSKWNVITQ